MAKYQLINNISLVDHTHKNKFLLFFNFMNELIIFIVQSFGLFLGVSSAHQCCIYLTNNNIKQ